MFIRLVVPSRDEDCHCLTGVFQAAYRLSDHGRFTDGEQGLFDSLCRWFNVRLPVPARLARSRRPHAHCNAVCWFKPDAGECIRRVRQLAALLDQHGVATEELRTRRPGYVVYEDAYQVVAVPFRSTRA
jgi:hypothetical protein